MSHTHVHTPGWVKMRQPAWRSYVVERHHHPDQRAEVFCDLAEHVAAGREWVDTQCVLVLAPQGRNIWCGCRMCTGHHDRRAARRRERYAGRRLCRSFAGE